MEMIAAIREAKNKYREATGRNPEFIQMSENNLKKLEAEAAKFNFDHQMAPDGKQRIFGIEIKTESMLDNHFDLGVE